MAALAIFVLSAAGEGLFAQGSNNESFQSSLQKKMREIMESDPFAITGTVGADASAQWATDDYTSSPFALAMYANLNLKIYNVTIPLHFNFMDVSLVNMGEDLKNFAFPKPTISLGMTPTVGNWKFHLGFSSMSFSKYVYSGMQFLGIGFEYQGKLFRAAGFGGSLKRPTRYRELDKRSAFQKYMDDLLGLNVYETSRPQFQRDAVGGKIGVGNKNNYFDISFLKAKDDLNSLDSIIPYMDTLAYRDSIVQGKENLAIGATLKVTPWKWMTFVANSGMSIYTANISIAPLSIRDILKNTGKNPDDYPEITKYQKLLDIANKVFTIRSNTQVKFAADAALKVTFDKISGGVDYKFIQADYASLGITSSSQNMQSVGGNVSTTLLDGGLVMSFSGYGQQDNMNKKQMYTNNVYTYNGSVSSTIGDYVGLALAANVVQQKQHDGTQIVDPTAQINQLTYTASASPSVNFYTDYSHAVAVNFNMVETKNLNKLMESEMDSKTVSVGASYDLSLDELRMAVNASYDYSWSSSAYSVYNSHTLGYGFTYQIVEGQKVRLGMSFSGSFAYNNVLEQGEWEDWMESMDKRLGYNTKEYYTVTDMKEFTFSNSLAFTFDTKTGHSLSLAGSLTNLSNRELIAQEVSTTMNASVSLSYSYSFAKRVIKHRTHRRDTEDM